MRTIKVKDLKPGDVLLGSGTKVVDFPRPYNKEYWSIRIIRRDKETTAFWKPNTTVGIL